MKKLLDDIFTCTTVSGIDNICKHGVNSFADYGGCEGSIDELKVPEL